MRSGASAHSASRSARGTSSRSAGATSRQRWASASSRNGVRPATNADCDGAYQPFPTQRRDLQRPLQVGPHVQRNVRVVVAQIP